MGILGASGTAAFIVFGLAAGVIADRARRRSVLIVTSLLSALVVATIPLAYLGGVLGIEQLYAVEFVAGSLGIVDQTAFQAILPRVVGRGRILETITVVRSADSVTAVAGPSLAGVLVQLLTAPIAIVIDAASFMAQSVLTAVARVDEPPPPPRAAGAGVRHEVVEGLRYVLSDRALRFLSLGGATHNVCSNGALLALYVLYMSGQLSLTPIEIGLVYAAGGPSALVGSLVAGRWGRRFGMRGALTQAQVLTGVARGLVPLAAFAPSPLAVLVAGEFLLGIARSIFNVNQLSMRLALTPDHMQGRMTASIRFLMWSVVPLGALAGGFAAEHIGLVPTLTVAAIGTALSSLWFLFIPREERAS